MTTMRSALCLLTLAASLVASGPPAVHAQEAPSSSEGALFLLLPVGAKAVALGRAMTAMGGPESVFWNPAGLSVVDENQVVLLRGDHAVGPGTGATALLASSRGTLGVSYFLLDAGELELRDDTGNERGSITVRNHLAAASAAARLFGFLDAGVTLKMVRFQFSCRGDCPDAGTTATTYAVDAGVRLLPSADLPLRFGAMLAHVGPRLQVFNRDQADPLPSRVRVAAAYDVLDPFLASDDLSTWVALEVEDRLRDPGSPSVYLGAEFAAGTDDALFLRAGYGFSDLEQEDGARVGLGFRYQRFELSMAKALAISTLTGESEPVHVTFAIVF